MSILAAIEKLREATEGSRELDSMLWPLFTREHTPEKLIAAMEAQLGREAGEAIKKIIHESWQHGLDHPPPYTRSIDSAIVLLPKTTWSLSRWENTTEEDPIFWFDLHLDETFTIRHKVPAIAICIAALRAL